MTRNISLQVALLVFVLICFRSVQAQEPVRPAAKLITGGESQALLFAEFAPNKRRAATLELTNVDTQASQSTTSTTTNSGYVFPNRKQRFDRYVRSVVGPIALFKYAASAGIEQWDNSPLEWGQGMKGYGKRFASNIGSSAIRQSVIYGMSEAFRWDTGFLKSKHRKFWPRVGDALIQNITSRTRSGRRVFSVPIVVGTYAGSIIPNETWYPDRYSYKDGIRGGSYTLLAGFGFNLVREFIFNF